MVAVAARVPAAAATRAAAPRASSAAGRRRGVGAAAASAWAAWRAMSVAARSPPRRLLLGGVGAAPPRSARGRRSAAAPPDVVVVAPRASRRARRAARARRACARAPTRRGPPRWRRSSRPASRALGRPATAPGTERPLALGRLLPRRRTRREAAATGRRTDRQSVRFVRFDARVVGSTRISQRSSSALSSESILQVLLLPASTDRATTTSTTSVSHLCAQESRPRALASPSSRTHWRVLDTGRRGLIVPPPPAACSLSFERLHVLRAGCWPSPASRELTRQAYGKIQQQSPRKQ